MSGSRFHLSAPFFFLPDEKSISFFIAPSEWEGAAKKGERRSSYYEQIFESRPCCQQIFKKNLRMIKHPAWISFGRKNGNKKVYTFFWITKSPFCIILRIADTRLEWKKYHLFNLKALQSTQHSFSMYTAVSRFRDWVHKTYIIITNKTATKIFRPPHSAFLSPFFFQHTEKNITGKGGRKENLMHFMYVRK